MSPHGCHPFQTHRDWINCWTREKLKMQHWQGEHNQRNFECWMSRWRHFAAVLSSNTLSWRFVFCSCTCSLFVQSADACAKMSNATMSCVDGNKMKQQQCNSPLMPSSRLLGGAKVEATFDTDVGKQWILVDAVLVHAMHCVIVSNQVRTADMVFTILQQPIRHQIINCLFFLLAPCAQSKRAFPV